VVPKMQATIEFVSGYVGQQVDQLDLTPPVSFAMHAKLIASYYLENRSFDEVGFLMMGVEHLR